MKTNIRKIFAIVCSLVVLTTAVCSSSLFTTAQSTPETTKESLDIVEFNCDTGTTREYTFEYDSIDINAPGAAQMLTSAPEQCTTEKTTYEAFDSLLTRSLLPGDPLPYQVDATVSPHSKVLLIKTYFPTPSTGNPVWTYGTAFMVAPDIALTSAHSVQQSELGYATTMYAFKKYQSESKPETGGTQPLQWSMPVNYTQGGDLDYDWCIIEFSSNMNLGYFNYQVPTSNTEVYVNGYPNEEEEYRYKQYRNGGVFRLCSDGLTFDHSCSTLGGQSGGPAYKTNGMVVGIHTRGRRDDDPNPYNHGCIITQALYNMIESVKSQ